jgi:signal transduction histidine kinase
MAAAESGAQNVADGTSIELTHHFALGGCSALLDAVTDGVVMALPNDQQSCVVAVNRRFAAMFGVAPDEAQGLALAALLDEMRLPQTVRDKLKCRWGSLPLEDHSIQTGEFEMSGTIARVEWYSAPIHQDDALLGRIYTFHDATPELLMKRLRYELLSRLSHELRTPLTAIGGAAQLVLSITENDLPDDAREYMDMILQSARHLDLVLSGMIDMARANLGELRLNLQEADLSELVGVAVARLQPHFQKRGQALILELDRNLPTIHVEVERILHLLAHLLDNASKFSPEGSAIRIRAQRIASHQALPASAPPDLDVPCLFVSILDEGRGVSAGEVDKIFLPFYRTESARAERIEGSGLGLALARSIVELHYGAIWAEPSRGKRRGGRFFFTLPTRE